MINGKFKNMKSNPYVKTIIAVLVVFAILSRLIGLGDRVMSHDEVNHVVPSFDLFAGKGYRQDPITHGPLQFHLIAASYFLFGDNDFSSRFPHAIFSIGTIIFVLFAFKKIMGINAALIAGFLFLISPFMLFYGRYARNEALVIFFALLLLFYVFEYNARGESKDLLLLSFALALHFISKETAFIYTAQLLLIIAPLSLVDIFRLEFKENKTKIRVIGSNIFVLLILFGSLGIAILATRNLITNESLLNTLIQSQPIDFEHQINNFLEILRLFLPVILPLLIGLCIIYICKDFLSWELLSGSHNFDILITTATLVLPLLAPFPTIFAGLEPSQFTSQVNSIVTVLFIFYLFGCSIILGSYWNRTLWWKIAGVFYGIFFTFYTTFFTNPNGIYSGLVSSLSHWLAQQGIQRGGQPIYYYALIQLPTYEFLAITGVIIAFSCMFIKIKKNLANPQQNEIVKNSSIKIHPIPFLFYWFISGLIAYSIAGEKMPWLTTHVIFPLLLIGAWGFAQIIKPIININKNQQTFVRQFFYIFTIVTISLLIILALLGNEPPFKGKTQVQLSNTFHFLFLLMLDIILFFVYIKSYRSSNRKNVLMIVLLSLFILLSFVTIRTSFRAAFINYDYPLEYLVYAHAAPGPKLMLEQIEEISRRISGGLDIEVAYDNHSLYPFWWYLRHYPNRIAFGENPTRSLENAPIIFVGQQNYGKVEPIVRDNYIFYEYMRLWWPNMDYYNLSWERIKNAISDANMRQALWEIWFNKDYSLYAEITNNSSLTLSNWSPSEKIRLYIRKDIPTKIWEYGFETGTEFIPEKDTYEENIGDLFPMNAIGVGGSAIGQFNAPRGMAIAADGSIYVADSKNHRIQKFSRDGTFLLSWGSFASTTEGNAPGGTFYEPWDIAIGLDGYIYVTDTWNHRIQKFTSEGKFVKMWGYFAQGFNPDGFWGPRGITVDNEGRIFITDTGNKRIVVFDTDGNYITQFGAGGLELGQMDEPVGLSFNKFGNLYVADTWNRRVQVFQPDPSKMIYSAIAAWDIDGWFGQSLNNKPFLTASPDGNIIVSDPEGARILQFSAEGDFIQGWNIHALSEEILSQPVDIIFDASGYMWISDANSNMILQFNIAGK